MPDHVHLLLEGTAPDADLRDAVSRWKQRTGYTWRSNYAARLWQTGFHDRVLRESDDTRAVVAYILQNPVRAGLVQLASEYPWTGSSKYALSELETHAGDWRPPWK
jgi:REP element-mobilizing transposase RayT